MVTKCKRSTSSETVKTGQGEIFAVTVEGTATGGSVSLKDGGSSGTEIFHFETPAAATFRETVAFNIHGFGLEFSTDLYAAVSNANVVTYYQ